MIDSIIEKEFKEASKITKKQYCTIAKYYIDVFRLLKDNKEEVYTEFEFREQNGLNNLALSYTRDFIWFDSVYL